METGACLSLQFGDDGDIDLDVIVKARKEYDDDGCGSPSATGNSMTGRRGSSVWVLDDVALDMTDAQIAAQVRKAFKKMDFDYDPAVARVIEGMNE